MMYQKANCFGDTKIAEKILETTDVAQIKALGRKVSNYNEQSGMESDRLLFTMDFVQNFKTLN